MDTEDYVPIVEAGAEGLVVYQETYNRGVYAEMHTAGPKRDFNFRLDCAERGYAAGFRRLGIGALFGLSRWQDEAIALAAHLEYLFKHCWQAQISVSVPRLRPAAGGFRPLFSMSDRELVQLVCALRITFPQVGIVLSTRERAPLRDALVSIGVTMMSAGSHTEPGGYTRQGREHLHRTVRGRIVAPEYQDGEDQLATGQFEISDERSPAEIAAVLRRRGLEPVWKDWDQALVRRLCVAELTLGGPCHMMTISLNGESVDTREAKTIAELIDRYQLPPQSILVEHNGLAVHRHEWAERSLAKATASNSSASLPVDKQH